ncbi:MAG: hypothetical protein RMJ98_18705 [Myxococcales bacterium]|nr:hypothetical protein [Myxococcales bacterium]
MHLVSRLFVPCSLLLLACGRSTMDGPEELPSVVDLSASGAAGSGGNGSPSSGQGGTLVGGTAGAGNTGGSAGAGNAAGSAGAGNLAGQGGSVGAGAAGSGAGGAGTGGSGNFGGSAGAGNAAGFAGSGGAISCPGGVFLPDFTCQSCVDSACCNESQGCANNKECNGLLTCLLECGEDPSCQQPCVNQFPGGIPRLQLLGNCVESSCSLACTGAGGAGGSGGTAGSGGAGTAGSAGGGLGGGGTGGIAGSAGDSGAATCPGSLPLPIPNCKSCVDGACCGESQACNADPQCVNLLSCIVQCNGSASCQQQCAGQFPGGIPELQKLGQCFQNSGCSSVCSGAGGTGGSAGAGGSGGSMGGSGGSGGGVSGAGGASGAGAGGGTGGAGGSGGIAGNGGAGGSTELCGDGKIDPGEQCDEGGNNADTSALSLLVNGAWVPVTPLDFTSTPQSFYNYFSASSHTGFEEVGASRVMLHRNLTTGQMSLVLHHGIDLDTSGQQQPTGKVDMKISGPVGMFVIFADDNQQELSMVGSGSALGSWTFTNNTDGGILGGFPLPGDWTLHISPSFQQGIQSWAFVDGSGKILELGTNALLTLQSRSSTSVLCRLDCTVPTCGDGRLDAGEQCDDGNSSGGDGCRPDCTLGL